MKVLVSNGAEQVLTRWPSNLRPTTRECVHLVTRGHFRSLDKDGGHNIRSAVVKNPMLHSNFMALYSIEPELLPIEVLHCEKIIFFTFLHLWAWRGPDDLHIRTLPVCPQDISDVRKWTSYVKAFESYRLTDIHTDRETRPKLYTTPLRGWSKSTISSDQHRTITLTWFQH